MSALCCTLTMRAQARGMAAFCCLFVHDGAQLVAGSGAGELLVWDVAHYWVRSPLRMRECVVVLCIHAPHQRPGYWLKNVDDAREPSKRVRVFKGPIYRMAMWQGSQSLLLAGADGLAVVELQSLEQVLSLAVPTAAQHSFNALAACGTHAFVGSDNGDILHATDRGLEHGGDAVFEAGAPVLDLTASPDGLTLYAALADGTIVGVSVAARAAMWRINLQSGVIERSLKAEDGEQAPVRGGSAGDAVRSRSGFQASLVRLDDSGRWLLCGGGSATSSIGGNGGGFVSVWHAQLLDPVSVLPLQSCPSSVAWVRGQVVLCGAESHCHLFTMAGMCVASSALDMREVWDVAVHQAPADVIGASMALVGAGRKVALLTAVGREPIYLKF